jgi:hypothetical protein
MPQHGVYVYVSYLHTHQREREGLYSSTTHPPSHAHTHTRLQVLDKDHETRASSTDALNHPFIAAAKGSGDPSMLQRISMWINKTLQVLNIIEP